MRTEKRGDVQGTLAPYLAPITDQLAWHSVLQADLTKEESWGFFTPKASEPGTTSTIQHQAQCYPSSCDPPYSRGETPETAFCA